MSKALKSALRHFNVHDNELLIGGDTISSILKDQKTPLYLYSKDILDRRHKTLRQSFPEETRFTYAVKANPHRDVVAFLGKLYDGLDVASKGEIDRCIEAGLSPEKMNFAGPGKSMFELQYAVSVGVGSFSIENYEELQILNELAAASQKKIDILLRVNPAYELAKSGVKMGGGPKQFGLDSEKIPQYISELGDYPNLCFRGIHIYAGTQNLNAESIMEAFSKSFAFARELKKKTGVHLNILNLGGGFGIPYFPNDEDLDIRFVGNEFSGLLRDLKRDIPESTVKIELGRYIVGECGIYVTQILYRKISRGDLFLILNGGMNHHLAASGNLGQSFHRPMPVTVLNKIDNPPEKANVVGPLCTSLDKFALGIQMPQSDVGDYVGVLNSGAYGYSASPLGFLSHGAPQELLL